MDKGVPREVPRARGEVPSYCCGEGLGKGYETCEVMTSDIVLPNVSTLLHVFSATLM